MVVDWSNKAVINTSEVPPARKAAQYVRMSTEHQRYSTNNQQDAISVYAISRGFEIVRTYADEGKSGLKIGGRLGLQALLRDIELGNCDFEAVLVYDISRWGRFQDPDEAASYELRCRQAGIAVHYCAEQFENDGSIGSSIIKTVKRAMAGEYSRELSVKVYAGQANLIRLGYRQGGMSGYGLRRCLIDANGEIKGQLKAGEHKSIQTDRVVLIPGPEDEQKVVRNIYAWFLHGLLETDIAGRLNDDGIISETARPWSRAVVHQILTNEKYVGNNVWGRTSFKLKSCHESIAESDWIRCDGAFDPIVDIESFRRVREIIEERSRRLTDAEMLEILSRILSQNGSLSGLIIDEQEAAPSSGCYRSRFGSLMRAYTLVGFTPKRDVSFLKELSNIRKLHPQIIEQICTEVDALNVPAEWSDQTRTLRISNEVNLVIVIARCFSSSAGRLLWKLNLKSKEHADFTLGVRMAPDNTIPLDYYLLPKLTMKEAILRLAQYNGLSLDAFRYDQLSECMAVFKRTNFRRAA